MILGNVGVSQGSLASCLLSVLFANEKIKIIKTFFTKDEFLVWLHVLLFMDDIVILSAFREGIMNKLKPFNRYTSYRMKVHLT